MPADLLPKVTIRDYRPENFDDIISLLKQLWPDRELNREALKDTLLRSMELDGHIIRCACYDEQVLGLCSISIRNNLKAEGNLANIDELVVDEKVRGQQIGKMLLLDAEEIAKANNCKSLGLESSFYREDAHRFYEENGYWKQGYYIIRDVD